MSTRRERVVLDLEDNFTPGVARAAVASRALRDELNGLGRTSTKTGDGLDKTSEGNKRVGDSARKAGPDIDRLSGRLRLLTDAAVTLGPALVPLGAATIPVLSGALAGLGAAAGGIGVAVLAFQGLGDAIKSIDEYRLEPTADNLQAMRLEMEKMGPAGAEFARFVANLEPELRDLQNTARGHLFAGIQDGLTDLLDRAPQVEKIINRISKALGENAADAGASLAGEDWDAFFKYVATDARPTLDAFADSLGNVTLGVANMLVAFAPLTRDFTGGLESATKAFADWSAGLDTNKSFQEFLDYVRQSGPQAVDFLAAAAKAIAGLLEAAAPIGSIVLPALTGIAKVFGAIASSPIGPGIYTAIAALVAFRRASDLTSRTLDRLKTSSDQTSTSLGRYGALAGGVLGVGAAVGALADNINRIDSENLERSLTALGLGNVTEDITKVIDSLEQLQSPLNAVDLGEVVTLGGLFGDSSLDKFADNVDQVDKALAQLVETGEQAQAADLFQQILSLADARGLDVDKTAASFDAYALAIQNVSDAAQQGSGLATLFGNAVGVTGDQLRDATGGAEAFSGALARLNGWFDKRDAVRGYKDAIDALRESMKNGFTREDAANLDNIGRSIIQVAEQIKNPIKRANFLAGARESLLDMARNAGPKARAAIQEVIDRMDDLGLTRAEPKITADNRRARQSADEVKTDFNYLNQLVSKPKVQADPGNTVGLLGQISNMLSSIDGRVSTATIRVNRVGGVTSSAGGQSSTPAGEGRVRAPRNGRTQLSPRASEFDRILGPAMRTSGSSGDLSGLGDAKASLFEFSRATRQAGFHVVDTFNLMAQLNHELKRAQKAYDQALSARDAAVSKRDSLSSSIQQGLGGSIWEGSGSAWAGGYAADTPQGALMALQQQKARAQRLVAAINTLRSKGITGPVLAEIIGSGDVERAEMLAAMDIGFLATFSSEYNATSSALAAAGLTGGNAVYGAEVATTQAKLDEMVKELRNVKDAIKDADFSNTEAVKENGTYVATSVNGATVRGHRNGKGRRR